MLLGLLTISGNLRMLLSFGLGGGEVVGVDRRLRFILFYWAAEAVEAARCGTFAFDVKQRGHHHREM